MSTRTQNAWAWLWGAVGALACAFAACLEPNLLEEGLPLHVAQRLMRGETLYRDVAIFTGPLPFELLALLFRALGDHLAVARAAVVVLHGLATAAVFALARRAGAGPLAHGAAAIEAAAPVLLFPLLSIYFHTTLAALFAQIAVYAAVRAVASMRWAIAAGVLVACVVLCKQTVGAALALGLLAGIALHAAAGRRLATTGAVIAGGAASAGLVVAAFAARGALGDLFGGVVTTPLTFNESYRVPYPALWPPGALGDHTWINWALYLPRLYLIAVGVPTHFPPLLGLVTWGLYLVPFLAIGATVVRAIVARGLPAAVSLQLAGVVAAATNLFPRSDWGHLSFALPAACVQLVLLTAPLRARGGPDTLRRRVAGGVLATSVVLVGLYAGLITHGAAAPAAWDARIPVRPVSEPYKTPAVPRAIAYLRARTQPGDAIFVARQEPLLYFATGTRNPTRYEGMIQGLHPQQDSEVVAALGGLRYVVMSEIDQAAAGYYAEELPSVQDYLEQHFRVPADFPLDGDQWLLVLERGAARLPTAIDLSDPRLPRRHWARYRSGTYFELSASSVLPHISTRHLRRPMPVVMTDAGGGVDIELDVPAHARFEADVGLGRVLTSSGEIFRPVAETYSVIVLHAGESTLLLERKLPPDPHGEETWRAVEADLSPFAGQRITLRLQVVPDRPQTQYSVAWWGSPRIVVPAPEPVVSSRAPETAP